MLILLREWVKNLAMTVPSGWLELVGNYSALRDRPELLPPNPQPISKTQLYTQAHATLPPGRPILFIEFGVWKGTSLRRWTQLNPHPDSRFYGFDSFHGLPEHWRQRGPGHFSTDGQAPEIDDPRVRFVVGWFHQTLPDWLQQHPFLESHTVVVHIDSDLHSSALCVLTRLHDALGRYFVLFDDYGAGEARALRDYLRAYGATFEPMLARVRKPYSRVPGQVFGVIQTRPTVET